MKHSIRMTLLAFACALCLTMGALPAQASGAIGTGAYYMGPQNDPSSPEYTGGGIGTGAVYDPAKDMTQTGSYNSYYYNNYYAPVVYDYALVDGTNSLNLRSGPGTEYAWLGSLKRGQWVGITGETGNWYSVYLPDSGLYGYMSRNFLKRADSVSGGNSTTGVVTNPKATSFLNLRQYPSYDAPVLGIYYNGTVFRLLSSSNGWYQVETDGKVGYFRQEYVTINGVGPSESAYVSTPNGGKVNLRNAPSYSGSSVVAQFANGSPVSVLLRGSSSSASGFWKVSINGVVGYVDSAFLKLGTSTGGVSVPSTPNVSRPDTKGYAIVNNPKATQYLNLRSQPSTSAKVIAQYKNGIRFEVIAQGETWCKVYGSASGNIGYLMTKYVKLYNLPSAATKTVTNGNSYVNLRSAPSKQTGAVYMRVNSGTVVTVLTPGDEWTQVRCGNTVGYMMTSFLK